MAKILHRGDISDGYMRGEGQFEILHTPEELQTQFVNIEKIGRVCYRSQHREITTESAKKFVRMILKRGHESVLEHSHITVIFSNVSRGFTHEMVRHRHTGYSQESTRYVDYDGGKLDMEAAELTFIYPPHIDLPTRVFYKDHPNYGAIEMTEIKQGIIRDIEKAYKDFRKQGWPPQDARQFLPIGTASKIAVTASFRQWRNIMRLRTQKAAHWEIRYMMCDLLVKLKEIIPVIFRDFKFSNLPDKDGYWHTL